MKEWVSPYEEGDTDYDHSAGAVYVGIKQGFKIFGVLLFLLFIIIACAVF